MRRQDLGQAAAELLTGSADLKSSIASSTISHREFLGAAVGGKPPGCPVSKIVKERVLLTNRVSKLLLDITFYLDSCGSVLYGALFWRPFGLREIHPTCDD